ncbi:MAG: GNAT family N-acetyltransferase [Chloroflexi bacterium]|nr:MAG: GNAT family N-acetyltransferase [Chloroflexota bacterium]
MKIVRAAPADADELKAICIAGTAYWGYPAEWMARWTERLRITPEYVERSVTYKAVDDGTIIAWYALVHGWRKSLLDHLWVTPPRIGTGVGRALFHHALDQARRAGSSYLELEADPHAVGFYEHMGARQVKTVMGAMHREIPVMVIDLEEAS